MFNYFMLPRAQKIPLIILSLFIWFSSDALASVIKLNSGKTIESEITYRDEEMIKVDSRYGIDITYYYDEIESIDGQPPVPIKEAVAIDVPIEEPEPVEINNIVPKIEPIGEILAAEETIVVDVADEAPEHVEINNIVPKIEPIGEIFEIKVGTKVEILKPIIIEKIVEEVSEEVTEVNVEEVTEEATEVDAEEVLSPQKIIPIVEAEPIKDISVVEEKIQVKELPSPFGPTIKENDRAITNVPSAAVKIDEPLPEALIIKDLRSIGSSNQKSMSDKIVITVERFIDKQKNNYHKSKIFLQRKNMSIQKKFKRMPHKIRKDILVVLSLVFIFVYGIICFPLMLIANKLKRKYSWLVFIPIVQIFYFVYIAKKPLWWSLIFLIPLANIVLMLLLSVFILREMKESIWLIIPGLIPGINIIVLWYLALSKIKVD